MNPRYLGLNADLPWIVLGYFPDIGEKDLRYLGLMLIYHGLYLIVNMEKVGFVWPVDERIGLKPLL